MNSDILRETLLELIDQKRLSGDGITFDGQPLAASEDSEYRPDGWSHETLFGCRRHRLIDQRLAKLREGDATAQELAEDFPAWYAFDPMDLGDFRGIRDYMASDADTVYPIEAEDADERDGARQAAWLARIRALHGGRRPQDIAHSFARRVDTDGDGRKEHIVLADCRVVFSGSQRQSEVTERWPAQALMNIESALEALRNPHPW